jgi:hypothetical protein
VLDLGVTQKPEYMKPFMLNFKVSKTIQHKPQLGLG